MQNSNTEASLAELVEKKLIRLFEEVAAEAAEVVMPEDAAGIPMAVFVAQQHMVKKWREYVDGVQQF